MTAVAVDAVAAGGGGATTEAKKTAYRTVDDITNASPTLLTLPRTDFGQLAGGGTGITTGVVSPSSSSDEPEEVETTVVYRLLQLPPDVTVEELFDSATRTYFVGPSQRQDDDDEDDGCPGGNNTMTSGGGGGGSGDGSNNNNSNNACFIVEGKGGSGDDDGLMVDGGKSYRLSHVETSNALVLVPPMMKLDGHDDDDNEDEEMTDDDPINSNSKRIRKDLVHMPGARLVHPSTFLECKRHYLDVGRLQHILRADAERCLREKRSPYRKKNNTVKRRRGYTVEELGRILRCSSGELEAGLRSIHAFQIPSPKKKQEDKDADDDDDDEDCGADDYTLLSEETIQDAIIDGIIPALSENLDRFPIVGNGVVSVIGDDDNNDGGMIPLEELIKEIIVLLREQQVGSSSDKEGLRNCSWMEEYNEFTMEAVVRHCIRSMLCCGSSSPRTKEEQDDSTVMVRIDMDKVALFLAHHLFLSTTTRRGRKKREEKLKSNDGDTPMKQEDDGGGHHHPSSSSSGADRTCWSMEEFLREWQNLLPALGAGEGSYVPSPDLLRGVALHTKKEDEEREGDDNEGYYLRYFPERNLSMVPSTRFRELFDYQDTWTLQQLNPYIGPLVTGGDGGKRLSQAELLLKYTRTSTTVVVVEHQDDCGGGGGDRKNKMTKTITVYRRR